MGDANGCRIGVILALLTALWPGCGWAQSPPTAVDDQYSANINNTLAVTAASGLLANDTGFDASSHRLEAVDRRTQYGGALSVAADGSFSYAPLPGFKGTDSFTYVVRNRYGASSGFVQIEVGGQRVWYVNGAWSGPARGTRAEPFNNLFFINGAAGANDLDGAGDTIFFFAGTYNGVAFDLEAGQSLIGEGVGLDLPGTDNDIPAGGTVTLQNTGTAPNIELFGAGGLVRGFTLTNQASRAIALTAGTSSFTLKDLNITVGAGTQAAIDLFNPSGASRIENVAISGLGAGIIVSGNAGTVDFVRTTVNLAMTSAGRPLTVFGNSGVVRFDATSFIGASNTRGILLNNNVATSQIILPRLTLAGGSVSEPLLWIRDNAATSSVELMGGFQLSNTTVNGPGLRVTAGRLSIGASDSNISVVDGEAIDLDGIELSADATLASVSSTSSQRTGMRFNNLLGTARFAVGTLAVDTPTAQGVLVNNSSGLHLDLGRVDISGGSYGIQVTGGRITVSDTASTVVTTAGVALGCGPGTLNASFATLSAAGGGYGIQLDSCQGTLTATGGTLRSAASASQAAVRHFNSNLVLDYAGALEKAEAGYVALVQQLPATASVTLSGTATGSVGSNGVFLLNNAGTVRFGTLSLGTESQRLSNSPVQMQGNTGNVDLGLFKAYTAGIDALTINLDVAGAGQVRTALGSVLDATGAAAALSVVPGGSTTVQPLDLHFASLSAPDGGNAYGVRVQRGSGTLEVSGRSEFGAKTTAGIQLNGSLNASFQEVDIAGATDGVSLDSLTGSFRITGDDDPLNTHTNGAGGSFAFLTDNAFEILDSRNVLVADVDVVGTGGSGVRIRRSSDLEFANVDLRNIGNAPFEHVYDLGEGIGSGFAANGYLRIHDSELRFFPHHGIFLRNYADTLALTIRDNVIADNLGDMPCGPGNCGGHGIWISTTGSAQITGLIRGNQIEDIDNWGILGDLGGSVTARLDLTIDQNTVIGHAYGGPTTIDNGLGGVSLSQQAGNASIKAAISNNTFRNLTGMGGGSVGVVDLLINGSNAPMEVSLTGNRVEQAYQGPAYRVRNNNIGGSAALLRVRMDNNVGPTADLGEQALRFDTGFNSGGGDNHLLLRNNQFNGSPATTTIDTVLVEARGSNNSCVDITGNTIAPAAMPGFFSLRYSHQVSLGTARLQGMTGNTAGQAITYLNANNTLASAAQVVAANIQSATCNSPTPPATVP